MISGAADGLRLAAPAKLNLSLRVVGRRPDGYHELDGIFVLVELADWLVLMPGASGIRVEGDYAGDVAVAPERNLAWRGLVAGLGAAPSGACLVLDKRIAAAAGLGGGSSDAAAAWRLGRAWSGSVDRPSGGELLELAAIGADVPFFAAQVASARVRGLGERIDAIEPPPGAGREVLLVLPPFGLPTAAVFAELRPDEWGAAATGSDPFAAEDAGNDLLAPARRLRPELDDLRRLAVSAGVVPRLTGSGPTLFALADDPERAAAAASRLRRAGLRVTRTRLRAEPARIERIGVSEEVER